MQDPQTFDGMGLVYAALMGDRNHEDSARKSKATQAGLQRRKEKGSPVGAMPLGYTVDKSVVGAPREVDPLTVPVIERIYDMVEAGDTRSATWPAPSTPRASSPGPHQAVLDAFSWPATFAAKVPVAIVAAGLVLWVVPTSRDPDAPALTSPGSCFRPRGSACWSSR